MKIAIASDHAGFESKKIVLSWLEKHGYEFDDMGPYNEESVDYPDYAHKVAIAVAKKEYNSGILLCGTGIGVSIAANKIKGIRAALVSNPEFATLARQHNNANIICLPARFMDETTIEACLDNWFSASFERGRHERRVNKIEPCCQLNS